MRSDAAVLRHLTGRLDGAAPFYLATCAVVCIDLEWWQEEPHSTTEVGISELTPLSTAFPLPHAANHLENVRVGHVRIKEHAHLLNKFDGAGNPNNFEFGRSKFVALDDAKRLIHETLNRRNVAGQYQPIILIMHDHKSKLVHLKDVMGLGTSLMRNVVKIIDTQDLTLQEKLPIAYQGTGAAQKPKAIRLADLVGWFNLPTDNLHTAGNDAGYTLIAAILLAQKEQPPVTTSMQRPRAVIHGVNIIDVLQHVQNRNRFYTHFPWGSVIFCTKCDSPQHMRKNCFVQVNCKHCSASADLSRRIWAHTHKTEKCVFSPLKQ
ncbi:hypothetical protein DM02DRAFT_531583 [Periconia macrospinosa]|uniref:Gfd2/YDR514C-like C-terminal domain-containing protein n=1 Tax=Periconia macrospinosa TaxID=97972 RepID=A0A2V1DKS1_9PLEO|nr:hypothetical protein DM02DRAFT_531583 [Periconia macrospinosa]